MSSYNPHLPTKTTAPNIQLYDEIRRHHASKVTVHWGHRLVGIDTLHRRLRFKMRRRGNKEPEGAGGHAPAAAAAAGGVGGQEEQEEEEIVVEGGGARVRTL